MLLGKQVDRMVAKIMRLEQVYSPFLVEKIITPQVMISDDHGTRPIASGDTWGSDFQVARFHFTAEGLEPGKQYRLFADTGAVEHCIRVNGYSVGILDHLEHGSDPIFRIHRYLLLPELKNGDRVTLEGYYSHSFPGTMPYDTGFTFSMDGYYPVRPFRAVGLAVLYEELYRFLEKLELLNCYYRSRPAGSFAAAAAEKVYLALFRQLSLRPDRRPEPQELEAARALVEAFLEAPEHKPYVGIIGHSHLDTAWLWPVAETRRKLVRTVSNAVSLLKRHPAYKFFLSTVLYLQWLEEDDPQLFAEVGEMIRQGRIEPNGATWVECDGNLTGAEALCRQFLRGKIYLREKFGYESDTFWLPDTFGYSAALPQILRQCGVKYFLTTKLSWNDTNYFPYETFLWRGIDGSAVPVHFNSIQTWIDEESVQKRLEAIRDKRESDCVLMAYGFGDGGGGPSEEMVVRAIFTQQNCDVAQVEHTTVSDFMARVAKQELPEYCGELYLELHRGTYTSIHALKQNNRRLEEALHDAELVTIFDGEDRQEETDGLYDVLLLNQFHDILPGTCIAEATDEAIGQQVQAIREAKEIIRGVGENIRYFNTLPHPRRELLPAEEGTGYTDLHGENRKLGLFAFDGFGYGFPIEPEETLTFDGETVKTPAYTAKLRDGVITSLVFDGKELVSGGLGRICWGENMPYAWDNWDIDADYRLKEQSGRFLGQQILAQTESLVVLRTEFALAEASRLVTDMIFRADTPLITFENRLEANDKHCVMRALFDTDLFASYYKCETQFGYLERSCRPAEKSDNARFEVCAHKWTDLSQQDVGITLLSDTKYGVSCQGSTLGLTLHKSGTHPDPRGDVGIHFFRYGLLPHTGAVDTETVRHAYGFSYRPVITARENLQPPFALESSGTVILETVKRGREGGLVLRFYESLGASGRVKLRREEDRKWALCNILEEPCQTLPAGQDLEITFKPFEIKTLQIL